MIFTESWANKTTRGNIGQGVYSLAELRLFVTFYAGPGAGSNVLVWLERALNPVGHRSRQPDYSFFDLVSLLVVSELIRHGLRMRKIKESELYLRKRTDADRPFAHRKLKTDGREVFIDGPHPSQLEVTGRTGGQQVQAKTISDFVREIEYSGDWARRWRPAPDIEIDPARQFGEPTVAGTRVLSRDVYETVRESSVVDAALYFDLPQEQIRNAVKFEEKLTAVA